MRESNEEGGLWEVRAVKRQKVKEQVFFLPTELPARNRCMILSLGFKIIIALTLKYMDMEFCVRSLSWVILNISVLRCSVVPNWHLEIYWSLSCDKGESCYNKNWHYVFSAKEGSSCVIQEPTLLCITAFTLITSLLRFISSLLTRKPTLPFGLYAYAPLDNIYCYCARHSAFNS